MWALQKFRDCDSFAPALETHGLALSHMLNVQGCVLQPYYGNQHCLSAACLILEPALSGYEQWWGHGN